MSSQNPIKPAKRYPTMPTTETSPRIGGTLEPMMSTATTSAKESRLVERSKTFVAGSSPAWLKVIFDLPPLVCASTRRMSIGTSRRNVAAPPPKVSSLRSIRRGLTRFRRTCFMNGLACSMRSCSGLSRRACREKLSKFDERWPKLLEGAAQFFRLRELGDGFLFGVSFARRPSQRARQRQPVCHVLASVFQKNADDGAVALRLLIGRADFAEALEEHEGEWANYARFGKRRRAGWWSDILTALLMEVGT